MSTATRSRIIDLWATPFLHHSPDRHAAYRDGLAALALGAPETDILAADDPAAVWLRSQIKEAARAFLDRWAGAAVREFNIVGRAVVLDHGEYRPLRNHPDAYLSGIYHIAVPSGLREDRHRSDVDSNAISFYDPRFAMNMGAIAGDPYAQMEKTVRPEPGVLILWPSFVDFFIHPNLSAAKKIAVHFKIIPEAAA